MFKFKNDLLPANFDYYFNSIKNIHNYHTRSSETNFFLPRFNNKSGHKLLAYQGSRLWTKLPLYLKKYSQLSYEVFRNKLFPTQIQQQEWS